MECVTACDTYYVLNVNGTKQCYATCPTNRPVVKPDVEDTDTKGACIVLGSDENCKFYKIVIIVEKPTKICLKSCPTVLSF